MNMLARLCAIGLLLCGLGLLSTAVWHYFGPEEGPGLIIEGTDHDFSHYPAGQTKVITFPFHNRGRRSVQIIGLADC